MFYSASNIFRYIFVFSLSDYIFPKQFNSLEWKGSWERFKNSDADGAGIYSELSNRKKVVFNLIRSDDLKLKNKNGIVEVLGLEDNKFEEDSWYYWVAFTAIDNKWLKLDFVDGVVDQVSIYED